MRPTDLSSQHPLSAAVKSSERRQVQRRSAIGQTGSREGRALTTSPEAAGAAWLLSLPVSGQGSLLAPRSLWPLVPQVERPYWLRYNTPGLEAPKPGFLPWQQLPLPVNSKEDVTPTMRSLCQFPLWPTSR